MLPAAGVLHMEKRMKEYTPVCVCVRVRACVRVWVWVAGCLYIYDPCTIFLSNTEDSDSRFLLQLVTTYRPSSLCNTEHRNRNCHCSTKLTFCM